MTEHTSKDFDQAIGRARGLLGLLARAAPARRAHGGGSRTISAYLDILFVAKSLERIGDHAKNVAGHAVYAAMGEDVRHATAQETDELLRP